MYIYIVLMLVGVFPVASILIETIFSHTHPSVPLLVGKWFVFWAVGVRLFLAGLRQALQPRFTARKIFELQDDAALPIVRELGFANLAMGLAGVMSLVLKTWVVPAAFIGGIFYGLAGVNHAMHGPKNRLRVFAMITDMFVSVLLAAYLVAVILK